MANTKEQVFILEYAHDQNIERAAEIAGLTAQEADDVLADPQAQKHIAKLVSKPTGNTDIDKAWILEELKRNHLDARDAGKFSESNRALELLGKTIALFTDKVDHSGTIAFEGVPDDELDRTIERLAKQAGFSLSDSGKGETH